MTDDPFSEFDHVHWVELPPPETISVEEVVSRPCKTDWSKPIPDPEWAKGSGYEDLP